MRIGVPKEVKVHEYRAGLTVEGVAELCRRGHRVVVESGLGQGIGADDGAYASAGADVVRSGAEVFAAAELIVKVKEPQPAELALLRRGQTLFAYLHLAPDPAQARGLVDSGATAIAFETVTDERGGLPLLAPMSEVAGRMAVQVAAHFLEKTHGGRGVLLSGAPGVPPATVVVLGAGTVGTAAARLAVGAGAQVVVLNRGLARIQELDALFGGRVITVASSAAAIGAWVTRADAVIGAALVPGGSAPKLVSAEMVRGMKPGAVVVDVAIDQGGCFETSRPTTHADPVYAVNGIIHYAVTNMPGAVPHTSTYALANATLPFVVALAEKGTARALAEDAGLRAGLNVHAGRITHPAVAAALKVDYVPPLDALSRGS